MLSKYQRGLLKIGMSLTLSLSLLLGSAVTGMDAFTVKAATDKKEESEREKRNAQLSRKAATQGMVLLENKDNVLPISASTDKNIALFGPGAERPIKGGTGSGDVNQRYVISVTKGLENAGFTITSKTFLTRWEAAYQEGLKNNGSGDIMSGSYVHPDELITDAELAEAAAAKTAVYVLSRRSGEGSDRKNAAGDYLLSETETKNLTAIGAKFDKVIVVLNVGGVIDTKFFSEIKGLDAMLLMSNAGMESGNALADVLTGAVTPSGKLTDTWAKDYKDYPSSETFAGNDNNTKQEDYTDGIYVGYRYFDSFNKTPAYEFGYGKSYTTFDVKTTSVTADAKQVKVVATVKNTGTCSGKEVVQVYFSAPDGTIEKPYQELAGYAKTDELKPGQSQELTITYATTEMSSYNEARSAYVMEKGDYVIRVGNSSRNTKAAAVISLDKDKTTEQLSKQLSSDKKITEISSKGQTSYQSPTESADLAAAVKISLSADTITTLQNASKLDDETVTAYVQEGSTYETSELLEGYEEKIEKVATKKSSLEDVVNKKATMQEFVAQFTQEELAKLCNGIGMASFFGSVEPIVGAQSDTVDGAAGETTSDLPKDYKVPAIVLADGPAGVRINQEYTSYPTKEDAENKTNGKTMYQFCTAWPIGTLLAQSWDVDLIEEVGKAIGEELVEMGVTLLLAPGMNIHRNPLCGRNFEYYSEDPFLTGTIAAAETFGVQSNPGVGVTLKHFAVNNQESDRNSENNSVTERTLREIYLKGFEIAVKSAQPMAIMTSYNKINSEWAMNSYDLITDMAREEWGFKGLVMTDWMCAGDDTVAMHAGNDLIMPGNGTSAILGGLNPVPVFDENGQVQLVDKSMWTMTYKGTDWSAYTPDPNGKDTLKATVKDKEITVTSDDGKEYILVDGEKIILNQTAGWTGMQTDYVTTDYAQVGEDGITYKVTLNKRKVMALGDVQKSAMNILNIIAQSYQMAKQMTGDGKNAVKYSSQFKDLAVYLSSVKGAVKNSEEPKPDDSKPGVTTVSISTAKIDKVKDQAYTGKALKPSVKVTLNNAALKKDTDYTVSYKNNKKIGKATVTVTGKGKYTGTKSVTFNIVPKKTASLKAVSKAKKQVKLTWKRDKQATGYEIYVKKPGSKKFTLAKKITKNKTVSFTAKKLKSKKQYQYKVRAYKKVGKTTYRGAYSAVKKVKVK